MGDYLLPRFNIAGAWGQTRPRSQVIINSFPIWVYFSPKNAIFRWWLQPSTLIFFWARAITFGLFRNAAQIVIDQNPSSVTIFPCWKLFLQKSKKLASYPKRLRPKVEKLSDTLRLFEAQSSNKFWFAKDNNYKAKDHKNSWYFQGYRVFVLIKIILWFWWWCKYFLRFIEKTAFRVKGLI